MPEQLRFDGRVAVVTGAGAVGRIALGLGRAYALLLASRGASVVVNDLGGSRHGDGGGNKAADIVVQEIRAAGGKAVANYDSVEDGEKVIKTAIDNFGRVDILINNAGILRDKSIAKISDSDWDLIHRVHLKGSFKTTQAAWPYFRKQNYGRIIMTSSNSGLYGNFGQANYSAAKLGLVGLNNTVAIEGSKYNIHSNVIVPTAASRLTEDILPPDFFAELRPELIAPVVAYLCHESCNDNGSIIESAAGWAGKVHLVRSQGGLLRQKITDSVTIEDVQATWQDVTDMSNASRLESIGEASGTLMNQLEVMKNNVTKKAETVDGKRITLLKFEFDAKDLILYALGIGASVAEPSDVQYLYEGHSGFKGFPTFFIQLLSNIFEVEIPGKSPDMSKLLHGEQYLEIFSDLPTSGPIEGRSYIAEIVDKGKNAVVHFNMDMYTPNGVKIGRSQGTLIFLGCGGFGGPKISSEGVPIADPPKRSPDATITQKTAINQAAIYRLHGDYNPLHIDPEMAALVGFKKPILHGLSTLGFACRHVLYQFANNDAKLFKAIKARFSNPVLPGQTLRTNMWQENKRIHFETSIVENGSIAISGAYVDLHEVVPRPTMQLTMNPMSADTLQSDVLFGEIKKQVQDDPNAAKSANAIFVYNITKNGKVVKTWTLNLKKPEVSEGVKEKADTTFTVSDEDFCELAAGKLNPQMAFMKGKLKIAGNIMLAEKMRSLLNQRSKL